MTDMPLDPENKAASVFDLDSFKLEKNEKARITMLDKHAKMMLAHYVRSGEPREDGSIPGRYYACLGDYKKVMEDGADPEGCPACAVAEPARDVPVSVPRRRFAMHIIRYRTNTKGQATQPLSLALEVWQFGDNKFNQLVDRQEEHGDLRKKDIIVTCTGKQYQSFDLDVAGKMLVSTDDSAKAQYAELKKERSSELDRLLCQTLNHESLERMVGQATPKIKDEEIEAEADSTLDEVLDEVEAEAEAEAATEPTAEVEAATGPAAGKKAAGKKAAGKKAAVEDPPKKAAETASFADLLDED